MKLLLDVGNTRLKWALWAGQMSLQRGEFTHQGSDSDWPSLLQREWANLSEKPDQIAVVEVLGGGFQKELSAFAAAQAWPAPAVFPADPARFGLISHYHQPAQLGVDRYAVMAGARALGFDKAIIVNCGTAVTFDVLMGHHHEGGLIMPGLRLMRDSLDQLSGIHGMTLGAEDTLPALSTADAVSAGCVQGMAAAIDGLVKKLQAHWPDEAFDRLLSGGDAQRLMPWLKQEFRICPDLVFNGLNLAAGLSLEAKPAG
ncbi:type III pantothenate kinase [Ectothiorhodosinus mongolicus]|uniref:Type III pantothenate kinase n=1 Tax=Ectothiorhodosinus mongolicus TaxID=233100 RepID=A0A1R3VZU7_9GAMM|nr:type III pantothenate kinase [Ectothiorhodosinus mongolicus]ULX57238.1 type III pantothenate kinase [Ectothiorhodosinus mongolicus]SIT70560.1 type III pantothenate kinase [Ectothiorhodosinus mongolicus]